MRSRSTRQLTSHALAQRLSTLSEILEADGELSDGRDVFRGETRYVRFAVAVPGYGLPRIATYEYEEKFRRGRERWIMTGYQYEIRFEVAPFGRKAFHWHDGRHHVHCQESRDTRRDDHYRGYEIDLLEDARPEFLRILAAGRLDCASLHPLRA